MMIVLLRDGGRESQMTDQPVLLDDALGRQGIRGRVQRIARWSDQDTRRAVRLE